MTKLTRSILLVLLLSALLYPLSATYAAVPHLINYQGKVTESGKLITGVRKVTFKIYDAETGPGTMTPWEEIYDSILIENGVFNVLLGSLKELNLLFDKPYFLEVKIGDTVMGPRQRIASVGYAIKAELAENGIQAQSADKAKVADTITDPTFLMPKGGIIMCKGNCPAGYQRVGELDGKFLVGGQAYSASAGGSNQKTLTVSNLPPHSHDITHGHNLKVTRAGDSRGGLLISDLVISTQDGGLITPYSGNSGSTGAGQSFDVRPEFATVIFCEKQ